DSFVGSRAYPNECRGDLVALLRTCRSLFYPAAQRLWGSLLDARHLLQLLPGVDVVQAKSAPRGTGHGYYTDGEFFNAIKVQLPAVA
ncbi:hypothetical protein FRC09_018380, partial [Ceratobasidium sp. 395]